MGSQLSHSNKVISIPNLQQQLQACTEVSQRECPIFGTLHQVKYNNTLVEIGKNQTSGSPSQNSLHYIIQPALVMLPSHCLLENKQLSPLTSRVEVLDIIIGICQLAESVEIGLGRNRVAFSSGRWWVYGESDNPMWGYQHVVKNGANTSDVYFSPEMMYSLCKNKLYPKIDSKQSDVFVLAVLLLEIMSEQNLQSLVYNFSTCEIKLAPILQALMKVQQKFGEQIYELLVNMLELEPESRFTFAGLKQQALRIAGNNSCYLSPINTKPSNLITPTHVKPKSDSFNPSPSVSHSPLLLGKTGPEDQNRGRSPGTIRKNLPLQDRENDRRSFSPIKQQQSQQQEGSLETDEAYSLLVNMEKQDHSRKRNQVCKITPNRTKMWEVKEKERPKVEPFGLKPANEGDRMGNRSFSKLKVIRY